MLMTPAGMALATMTVMLWIMWSDTLRAKRPSAILYTMRISLFLVVSGIFILNMVRYPAYFAGSGRVLSLIAVAVGFLGAAYFARRLVLRK
jgi:hypothetical protein